MASQKQQYTILYGRLSQEDERAGESNSILHQRELLESYAQAKGFENTLFLADDGYSGTNFDRPSWKKIIEMIEAGEVSTLIVKDTSRLGREYLQGGQDIHEASLDLQQRVRGVYLDAAREDAAFRVVDCCAPDGSMETPERIFSKIEAALAPLLNAAADA